MKRLIINMRMFFYFFLFSILVLLGLWTLDEDLFISIGVIVIGAFFILGYILLMPNFYVIDAHGITVYYALGIIKKSAAWGEMRTVEDHCTLYAALPWWREYHIGYFKSTFPLWKTACIPKNRQTTRLIEKYYKKTIKKYG